MVLAVIRNEAFLGMDSFFELFSATVTLFVFLLARKMYLLSNEEKYKYLMISFGALSVAFFVRALTNSLMILVMNNIIPVNPSLVFTAGYTIHVMLTLGAYVLLVCLGFNVKERISLIILLMALMTNAFLSVSFFTSFYLFSLVLLAFITLHFCRNWCVARTSSAGIVCSAFALITLAQGLFLLDLVHTIFSSIGYAVMQLGYLVLFIALLKVMK